MNSKIFRAFFRHKKGHLLKKVNTYTKIKPEKNVLMLKDDYINQFVLPLDLSVILLENDFAFSIHHLVESNRNGTFHAFVRHSGCLAYHP